MLKVTPIRLVSINIATGEKSGANDCCKMLRKLVYQIIVASIKIVFNRYFIYLH